MKKRTTILFFTPYATRTGSEMMLLYILKHLDRQRFRAALVSFSKGELLREVPSDIPVFIGPGHYSLTQKIAFHLGVNPMERFLKKVSKEFPADIWYVNTVMLSHVVKSAHALSVPVLTHIHELSHTFAFVNRGDYQNIIDRSDLLVGCSEAVCNDLRDSGGKKVKKLASFMDLATINPNKRRVAELRESWGVKPGDFVWIMSGTTSERKGFDLIPDLAHILDDPTLHVVWVGKSQPDGLVYLTEKKCQKVHSTKIHLVGAQKEDYFSYLEAADGFILTSRQEPLGLVMVEAAWLGKPIVAFDSGGPAEFITENIGTIVPNLNLAEFSQAMKNWRQNRASFDTTSARERATLFGAECGMIKWERIVENFLENH